MSKQTEKIPIKLLHQEQFDRNLLCVKIQKVHYIKTVLLFYSYFNGLYHYFDCIYFGLSRMSIICNYINSRTVPIKEN